MWFISELRRKKINFLWVIERETLLSSARLGFFCHDIHFLLSECHIPEVYLACIIMNSIWNEILLRASYRASERASWKCQNATDCGGSGPALAKAFYSFSIRAQPLMSTKAMANLRRRIYVWKKKFQSRSSLFLSALLPLSLMANNGLLSRLAQSLSLSV